MRDQNFARHRLAVSGGWSEGAEQDQVADLQQLIMTDVPVGKRVVGHASIAIDGDFHNDIGAIAGEGREIFHGRLGVNAERDVLVEVLAHV